MNKRVWVYACVCVSVVVSVVLVYSQYTLSHYTPSHYTPPLIAET